MRLRLTIQRHLLASVDILWSVDTSNPRATLTIAQLIEQVNEVVPLEHDQWGLEDYVTEVKGYECIHHFRVRDVLRDEDEVTYVMSLLLPFLQKNMDYFFLLGRSLEEMMQMLLFIFINLHV